MTPTRPQDARTSPRHEVHLSVKLSFDDPNRLKSAVARNISKGGMFIKTPSPPPLGSFVNVNFRLEPLGKAITLQGQVVHSIPKEKAGDGRPAGMGLKFTEIPSEYEEQLQGFIDTMSAPVQGTESHEEKRFMALFATLQSCEFLGALGFVPTVTEEEVDAAFIDFLDEYNPSKFLGKIPEASQKVLQGLFDRVCAYYKEGPGIKGAAESSRPPMTQTHLPPMSKAVAVDPQPAPATQAKATPRAHTGDQAKPPTHKDVTPPPRAQRSAVDRIRSLTTRERSIAQPPTLPGPENSPVHSPTASSSTQKSAFAEALQHEQPAQPPDHPVKALTPAQILNHLTENINDLDYFQILGISPEASVGEIKRTFYHRSRALHPDMFPGLPAEEKIKIKNTYKRIIEAYTILKDPQTRTLYTGLLAVDRSAYLRLSLEEQERLKKRRTAPVAKTEQGKRYFQMGMQAMKQSNYIEAERHFKTASTFEPDNTLFKEKVAEVINLQKGASKG